MHKPFSLIFISFFILGVFFITPAKTQAAVACSITTDPADPDQSSTSLKLNVTGNGLADGNYRLTWRYSRQQGLTGASRGETSVAGGQGSFDVSKNGRWQPGSYTAYIASTSKTGSIFDNYDCIAPFTIKEAGVQAACTTNIEGTALQPSTPVTLRINGLASGNYDIYINGQKKRSISASDGDRIDMGTFSEGLYKAEIKDTCLGQPLTCANPYGQYNTVCKAIGFRVGALGSTNGGEVPADQIQPPLSDFCQKNPGECSNSGGSKCTDGGGGISTAIGCIPTEPKTLVNSLIKYSTLVSGGLAFLFMIMAAFQMITAEGNPQSIKSAQEKFYSAIIGLLFIIFAVLLMQVIGVDVLGLKGFGA